MPSETADSFYMVRLHDEDGFTVEDWWERQPSCTCLDNQIRHVRCKHIHAVFHLLRDITDEAGRLEEDLVNSLQVQGYPEFLDSDHPPEHPPWVLLLDRVFRGQHRLDDRYDEFQQGRDIPEALNEDLWAELTFHRFLAGMFKVLRFMSEEFPAVDARAQAIFQRRHDAITYELRKRAAPILEARFNDFFASDAEAELAWTLWNLAMHGLERPIPPFEPPERHQAPATYPERAAPLKTGVDEAFGEERGPAD